jgi:predicted nucleotidyltransferase
MVRRLAAAYEPERIYLFGSRARGDAGPDSDYDLLVVVPDDAAPERRSCRRAYTELIGVGAPKDIVVMTDEYYRWMLGAVASLSSTVEREGRLLYGA